MSDLFEAINRDRQSVLNFFKLRSGWVSDDNKETHSYLAFDSTSISTASEGNRLAAWGKNKDGDLLAQVNVALITDQRSGVPIYFRLLDGSVPDVVTLGNTLKDAAQLALEEFHLVMDRAYYSADNLSLLLEAGINFVVGTKTSIGYVKSAIAQAEQAFWRVSRTCHYQVGVNEFLQIDIQRISWSYLSGSSPCDRDVFRHLYSDNARADEQRNAFMNDLTAVMEKQKKWEKENKVDSDKAKKCGLSSQEQKLLERFFIQDKKTGKWTDNFAEQSRKAETFGVFCLVSNDIVDPLEALEIYRQRNMVERNFKDLKQRLNAKRAYVQSERAMYGKTFVQFVALSICMVMHRRLTDNGRKKLKFNSLSRLIRSLNALTKVRYNDKHSSLAEITKTQRDYFNLIGVAVPSADS